jgi:hypothetical protein
MCAGGPGRHCATALSWADGDATWTDANGIVAPAVSIVAVIVTVVAVPADPNIDTLGLGRSADRGSLTTATAAAAGGSATGFSAIGACILIDVIGR